MALTDWNDGQVDVDGVGVNGDDDMNFVHINGGRDGGLAKTTEISAEALMLVLAAAAW